ncbi:OsmC family protein [Myroides albus]|uniref:OsmC family peroxiredoxin n=1 Tax=Myroides albus TaxID=2562892 RepID=A0A6I3LKL0_9FLAO|nr:OsmC family protein [Myroides albus]MTG99148.1 OsmC family peroxiredoxin [Myroides albus]UVD79907.1 OsmC family protein [Myroides albus]
MDVKVKAVLGKELYYTEVVAGNNQLITDEPKELGGGDKGFNPFELLATSLASCTAATLRMYADRKAWDLGNIEIEVNLQQLKEQNKTLLVRTVRFGNADLDVDQLKRLDIIANKCPVHKALEGEIEIQTIVK